MIKYKNECIDCIDELVPHYYCDECGEEIVEHPEYRDYFTIDGSDHLCKNCYDNALDYLYGDDML